MKTLFKSLVIGIFVLITVQPAFAAGKGQLETIAEKAVHHADDHQLQAVKQDLQAFHSHWKKVEDKVHQQSPKSYENIETDYTEAKAALTANNPKHVEAAVEKLEKSVESYLKGQQSKTGHQVSQSNVSTLIHELNQAQSSIAVGHADVAKDHIKTFIQTWPAVEGQVKTKSPQVYTHTENQMTKALSLLSANPPNLKKAKSVIGGMKQELKPFAAKNHYSFWDAAIILLREGLEIILILAALLGFLKKTNNADKRKWIWGGTGAGVVTSIGIAFLLTSLLSAAAAGANREILEGITGLIAVVVMFTVGSWLHNKSNIASWNMYIKDKVGTALARGSLWSLAGVAFLTVVREGAETVIFYLGIAPVISTSQLILGISLALGILALIALAIMKFSIKLPIGTLFLCISLLIYYLAFKFTGQSLHALQVVGYIPVHEISPVLSVNWLGIYPTLETTGAQALLLALIIGQMFIVRRRSKAARQKAAKAEKQNHSHHAIQGNR